MSTDPIPDYNQLKHILKEYPEYLKRYQGKKFPNTLLNNCLTVLQYFQNKVKFVPEFEFYNDHAIWIVWHNLNNKEYSIKIDSDQYIGYYIRKIEPDNKVIFEYTDVIKNGYLNLSYIDMIISQMNNFEYEKTYEDICHFHQLYNKKNVNVYTMAINILNYVKMFSKINSSMTGYSNFEFILNENYIEILIDDENTTIILDGISRTNSMVVKYLVKDNDKDPKYLNPEVKYEEHLTTNDIPNDIIHILNRYLK